MLGNSFRCGSLSLYYQVTLDKSGSTDEAMQELLQAELDALTLEEEEIGGFPLAHSPNIVVLRPRGRVL